MRTSGGHKQVYIYYFKPPEYNRAGVNWYPMMCPRHLVLADSTRHTMGPMEVSGALGSVGRRKGQDDPSQHNVDYWDECRATDYFFRLVRTQAEARRAVDVCIDKGWTGIGVYPEWTNNYGQTQVGFHLDTRRTDPETKEPVFPGNPSTWGKVAGEWVGIECALSNIKE